MDNTDWPTTVPILSLLQTTNNQYCSPYEDGYPTDLISWVEYSFPIHEHRIAFWTMYYKVGLIFNRDREHILSLMRIASEYEHITKWNTRIQVLWNATMYLLGYTENQSERTTAVAQYIQGNNIFQKLDAVVGCRNGIYYPIAYYIDDKEVTMNRAVTINRREFNAEEETNTQDQDYATRPIVNRSTNKPRQTRPQGIRPPILRSKGNTTVPPIKRTTQTH